MKVRRCALRSDLSSEKSRSLEVRLSSERCDVYGCMDHQHNHYADWWTLPSPYHYQPPPSTTRDYNHSRGHRGAPKGVVKYFFDALAKSSINGISNCSASRSIVGKLIWLALFTLCLMGFSYQASHFYQLYRNKPSVVQIEVENDGEVDFPAVTVCNTNRVRKSAFCKHYSTRCKAGETNLTESQINELLYDLLLEKKEKILKDLGHSKSMFVSCNFIGTPVVTDDECLKIWEPVYDPDYGNCYTFSSKKNERPLQARKVDFWQEENDLTLVLNSEPSEFMENKRTHGLLLVVHDERAYPDLHTEGLLVTPGFSYTITVAKSTVLLLPPPYKTNCTDYRSLPWQKMLDRRLTSRLCTVGCSQHFQFEKCQLVTKNLSLFYEKLPYEKKDINDEKQTCSFNEERRTIDYCRSICGLPCRETLYTAAISSSKLSSSELSPDYVNKHREKPLTDDIIYVRIFYSTLEHKIFRHIPKYDTMELFSFLGGYSGVWLGFSILTIYELLEISFSTVLYFFRTRFGQHRNLLRTLITPRKRHNKASIKAFKKKRYYS